MQPSVSPEALRHRLSHGFAKFDSFDSNDVFIVDQWEICKIAHCHRVCGEKAASNFLDEFRLELHGADAINLAVAVNQPD